MLFRRWMPEEMIHVVLYQPDIPQNTGNIARTCALTGARLHLIRPLGFSLDSRSMKRAGLDYWDKVQVELHDTLEDYLQAHPYPIYALTTKGDQRYDEVDFPDPVSLLFGAESSGLPIWVHEKLENRRLYIPMQRSEHLRSLNLANSVAIIIYSIWQKRGFL